MLLYIEYRTDAHKQHNTLRPTGNQQDQGDFLGDYRKYSSMYILPLYRRLTLLLSKPLAESQFGPQNRKEMHPCGLLKIGLFCLAFRNAKTQ